MSRDTNQLTDDVMGEGGFRRSRWEDILASLMRGEAVLIEVPWVFEDGRFGRHELLLMRLLAGRVAYHNPEPLAPLPAGSPLPGNALLAERLAEDEGLESLPIGVLRRLFEVGRGLALFLAAAPRRPDAP